MSKLKRGYYQLIPTIVTENGASMHQKGELTRLYRDFLEENIRLEPSIIYGATAAGNGPTSLNMKKNGGSITAHH